MNADARLQVAERGTRVVGSTRHDRDLPMAGDASDVPALSAYPLANGDCSDRGTAQKEARRKSLRQHDCACPAAWPPGPSVARAAAAAPNVPRSDASPEWPFTRASAKGGGADVVSPHTLAPGSPNRSSARARACSLCGLQCTGPDRLCVEEGFAAAGARLLPPRIWCIRQAPRCRSSRRIPAPAARAGAPRRALPRGPWSAPLPVASAWGVPAP